MNRLCLDNVVLKLTSPDVFLAGELSLTRYSKYKDTLPIFFLGLRGKVNDNKLSTILFTLEYVGASFL